MFKKLRIWVKYFLGLWRRTSKDKVKLVKDPQGTYSKDGKLMFVKCFECDGHGCDRCLGSGLIFVEGKRDV